jgi:hypothetical protein
MAGRLVAAVHFNIGVMRNATFFPVNSHFLSDKRIGIFAPDIAARTYVAPSCQHFFISIKRTKVEIRHFCEKIVLNI